MVLQNGRAVMAQQEENVMLQLPGRPTFKTSLPPLKEAVPACKRHSEARYQLLKDYLKYE